MEIIGIETATYEKTLKEIENFLDTVDGLIATSSHKAIGEWLDNQEVCLILKISPRTLQNLRDTDQISYSQMGRKIYYKKGYSEIHRKTSQKIMSKVITQDNEQVIQIYNRLKDTLMKLENVLKDKNPNLNGHRYMNDAELANYLKVQDVLYKNTETMESYPIIRLEENSISRI